MQHGIPAHIAESARAEDSSGMSGSETGPSLNITTSRNPLPSAEHARNMILPSELVAIRSKYHYKSYTVFTVSRGGAEGLPIQDFTYPGLFCRHSIAKLYRECLRRADYVGSQQGNREALISLVRNQFRRNMGERDPVKIEEQKAAAARALFNHMYYEAERMASQQAEDALIKEELLGLPKPAIGHTLYQDNAEASK